ncbi:MAG: AAA family ATPase [Chlamydiia bacterium]|nr:AAA family ATPase [Chlamydiia bacterium]
MNLPHYYKPYPFEPFSPAIDELPGNPHVKAHLKKLLKKVPHALLFEGPQGVGKGEFAKAFARALLKTSKKEPPDLRHLYPEGKGNHHPMHAIKQFIEETTLPPFEAERKVFIIHEAEKMLPTSSNALLKTLEEPAGPVTIILVSSRPKSLLPTITSRCFRIPFSLLTEEEIIDVLTPEKTPEEAHKIALLSHGSLEKARFLASKEEDPLPEQMFHVGFRLLRGDLPLAKELPEIEKPEEALSYLFYFYRDLHLLRSKGDPSLLFYQEKAEVLSQIKGSLPSLDVVQENIEKALLAAELHLPLAHVLPLFLQRETNDCLVAK